MAADFPSLNPEVEDRLETTTLAIAGAQARLWHAERTLARVDRALLHVHELIAASRRLLERKGPV